MKPDWYFDFNEEEKTREVLRDVVESSLRGLLYGRIEGEDAHNVYANLSIANMGFNEFLDDGRKEEIIKVPREGWSGHRILEDEWECGQL
ncbi:hypothetical protein BDV12DRAFT_167711 [Aspergillus spectabilis]